MKLVLYDMKTLVAKEVINDDLFEIWCGLKNENKHLAAPAAFFSRLNIQPNTTYLNIVFLDEESDELLELNGYEPIHKAMIKHNLYPEFISNGLKRNYITQD